MTLADWLRWSPTAAISAAKTAAGILLAWALVLWFQWPDAFLAPMAVLLLQTPYLGASLRKGLMRVFGTLAGALAVLLLLAGLIQDRWALLAALSLVIGLSVYQIRASRYGYAWFMLAITATVIAADAFDQPELAFQLAVYRTSEAVLGIVIVLVINGLFWPRTAGGIYHQSLAESLGTLADYLRALAAALRATSGTSIPRPPPKIFGASVQLRDILTAAALDSSGFRRLRRTYEAQIRQLSVVTGSLLALAEILRLTAEGANPILDASHREPLAQTLETLAAALSQPLAAQIALHLPQLRPQTGSRIHRDNALLQALSHQCRTLADSVSELQAATQALAAERSLPAAALPAEVRAPLRWRLQNTLPHAGVAIMAFWLTLLIWFQWQWPPSGFLGALMAVVIVGIDTLTDRPAEQPGHRVFFGALAGALLTAPLYLMVMPHLDGFVELALVLAPFYYTGLYFFHAHDKPHHLPFLGLLMMGLLMPQLAPEQTYSLTGYLNSALSILSGYAIGLVTMGILIGQRPHVRLRHHLQALLHSIASVQGDLAKRSVPDFIHRMQVAEQHQRELLQRLSQVAPLAFDPAVPQNDPARIAALVAAAQSLSIRARALQRARAGLLSSPAKTATRSPLGRLNDHLSVTDAESLYPSIIAGHSLSLARALRDLTAALDMIDWLAWQQPRF